MTQDVLDIKRSMCNTNVKELQNEAPYLCASFLYQRRIAALARDDSEKVHSATGNDQEGEEKQAMEKNA